MDNNAKYQLYEMFKSPDLNDHILAVGILKSNIHEFKAVEILVYWLANFNTLRYNQDKLFTDIHPYLYAGQRNTLTNNNGGGWHDWTEVFRNNNTYDEAVDQFNSKFKGKIELLEQLMAVNEFNTTI